MQIVRLQDHMDKIEKYRSKIFQNFVPLADVAPLPTPFTIHIDPTNACNFRCVFCPTGDLDLLKTINRPKGTMRLEFFQKLIDDIGKFDSKLRKLQLYKDGEPLLNKQLPKMIAYAKQKQAAESVETTTNGALLTVEKSKQLIDAGLDVIRVSIEHVNDEGYSKITQNYSDYNQIRSNIENLFNLKKQANSDLIIHAKIVDANLSDSEKQKFYDDFSSISDTINIDSLMDWDGSDTYGRDFAMGQKLETGMNGVTKINSQRSVCSAPFKSMAVNFNGQVSVCCVDWGFETLIGDSHEESLLDIWNGEAMRKFRIIHLEGKRNTLSACADCQYMHGFSEYENLDGVADKLLAELK